MLKTNRDVSKLLESEGIKTREDVTNAMKDKWTRQREREKELAGWSGDPVNVNIEDCALLI